MQGMTDCQELIDSGANKRGGWDDLGFVENAIHVNPHEETESYAITHFFNVKILSHSYQCSSTIVVITTIMEIAPPRPYNHDVDNPSPSIDIHYSVCIHNTSPTIQSIFETSKEESRENRYPW
jgi:hypothetical protein